MLCLLVGGRDESSDESKIRRALHREAGSLPGFHPYLRLHLRTPTRRSRHPASLPRQPAFGPPDDRHPRTKRLHPTSTRHPQKHRNPRAARKLADPPMARYQNVKITVMNNEPGLLGATTDLGLCHHLLLGQINFLSDRSMKPYMTMADV